MTRRTLREFPRGTMIVWHDWIGDLIIGIADGQGFGLAWILHRVALRGVVGLG